MERLICLAVGYVCGLFQTGYLVGKMNHIDIRKEGSGNSGTTNALRVLGWKAGIFTFLGDVLKCVAAYFIVRFMYRGSDCLPLLVMYAGAGVTLGHNFPFYMNFKGGKGIAATAGLILATNPIMMLIATIVFILVVAVTRYVSLGSLILVVLFLAEVIVYGQMGGFSLAQPELYEMYVIAFVLMLMAFYRHRANIKRLLNGTENKFGAGRKTK